MRRLNLLLIAGVATLGLLLGSQSYAAQDCPRDLSSLVDQSTGIGTAWDEIRAAIHRRTTLDTPTRDAVRMVRLWRRHSLALLRCMDERFRDGRRVLDPVGLAERLVKKLASEAHRCIPTMPSSEEACHHLAEIGLMVHECNPNTNETCTPPDPAAGKSSIEVWSDEPDPDDNIHLVIVVTAPPDDDE